MTQHDVLKAYEKLDFLHSAAARPIRVLCELMEPEERFRRQRIKNTIVFFGSTHIQPESQARENLRQLLAHRPPDGPGLFAYQQDLDRAQSRLTMSRYYEDARDLATRLTQWSLTIKNPSQRFYIGSGGGPGIMEAANRGALEAGGKTVALNISLPAQQLHNIYQNSELSFEFHYFFMRKFWFVYLAKALVIFPGGFGTMDELFELLTLVQTQKSQKYMPILIYGSDYWNEIINFDALVKWGTIQPADLKLFRFVDDVDTAFDYLHRELTHYYLERKPPPHIDRPE